MRVGITVDIRHSMFSAGHPNSSIAVAEVFQTDGHEVIFLKKDSSRAWWDDVKEIEAECVNIDEVDDLDIVIEIGYFLTPLQRKKVPKSIWYCRKEASFTDIESTIYGSKPDGRDLEGLSEIWVADLYNKKDDVEYLNLLYPGIAVKTVPWIWTPTIVETHRKTMSSPVWMQVKEHTDKDTKWTIHISESNASSTSSCTIPMLAIQGRSNIEKIQIHNTQHLEKNEYFKRNIIDNSQLSNYNLVGRQRIIDWSHEPNSVIIGHSRFISLKQANLEAAWVGIPIIHNNPVLRDFECGLELTYYEGNNLVDARSKLDRIIDSHESIPYLTDLDKLTELRRKILYRFSPEARAKEWLMNLKTTSVSLKEELKTYTILFTDMWDQFNPEHNMFTLAFSNYMKNVNVIGTDNISVKPDIHIFGPFGSQWKQVKGPKIHYTGENTGPILDPSVKLNLGYQYSNNPSYLRLPLWMLSIDWFNCDLNKIQNPLPIPVEACMTSCYKEERSKFCAFIVSNPSNEIRNEAFNVLNAYKPVDSAGNLFNNVGPILAAGLGGGGGELKKHEFLKGYRFCLAYENQSSDGYTTEKLLHAKAAGCVPIYWGDSLVGRDFDTRGFINLTGSPGDLLKRVKELEENHELLEKMASVPALSNEKRVEVLETLNEMVKRTLSGNLVVTSATAKFWPSLIMWLNTCRMHTGSITNLRARVYVGEDVEDNLLNAAVKEYDFATFIRFPTKSPAEFKDFWNPKHYAWKTWVYNDLVNDVTIKGSIVLYSDCASVLIRWPTEWIQSAIDNEVSLLEDNNQINKYWCHEEFCSILNVSNEEKLDYQVLGGLVCFIAGKEKPTRFFSEVYKLACNRKIIVGGKWAGIDIDGHPRGHRHDQSIMSIISNRQGIYRYPMIKVYNDVSARSTYYNGQSVYVHRGDYKTHVPVIEGIDDAYVINLNRRQDRLESFKNHHPYFKGIVRRHQAVDGQSLSLTPKLAGLLKPNDFFWKKAVSGCALSHLKLWTMLYSESPEIKSYLIMEDDGRLQAGWKEAWANVYSKIPDDWECVYLGGVLPPNKEGFKTVLEPVVEGLSRIAPNTFFGQSVPTRQFHFCAYAYVLSRAGVKKIISAIQSNGGIWTSADHVLFNSLDKEHVYVLDPLVAGASQDDDPAYINSDFNDFSRIDKFDSDLWNNDERFSKDEIDDCLQDSRGLDIMGSANDAYSPRVYFLALDTCNFSDKTLYETAWLQELFGSTYFSIKKVSKDYLIPFDNFVICIIRDDWTEQIEWIKNISRLGKNFKILHFSDEFIMDPVSLYDIPGVKGVMRFYKRNDIVNEKVLTIPLGYHWTLPLAKPLEQRTYTWSFTGTNWANRSNDLKPLLNILPNKVEWYNNWNDSLQLNKKDYLELLSNTVFVPCPRGNNVETYRFYEALECGCIPVFIELPHVLADLRTPFVKTESWIEVHHMIEHLSIEKKQLIQYHKSIMDWWGSYKLRLKHQVSLWLSK
jgi:GR25 family glycosyltransferase involved in LPS biosynthesis